MAILGYPKVVRVRNGWAALGPGWAAHGETEEEARERYEEAESRHRIIDAREPRSAGQATFEAEG